MFGNFSEVYAPAPNIGDEVILHRIEVRPSVRFTLAHNIVFDIFVVHCAYAFFPFRHEIDKVATSLLAVLGIDDVTSVENNGDIAAVQSSLNLFDGSYSGAAVGVKVALHSESLTCTVSQNVHVTERV